MSNILCVETCIGKCSVALKYKNSKHYAETKTKFAQSEQLFVLIKKLLDKNNCDFSDLSAICCTIGPGSFTGIRIGLAAAKGINKILNNLQLLGVSTLELMVSKLQLPISEEKILAVLNAGARDLYAQEFDSYGNPLGEIYLLSKELLAQKCEENILLLTEPSSFKYQRGVEVNITANDLLNLIEKKILDGKQASYEKVFPMYIKEPDITIAAHLG